MRTRALAGAAALVLLMVGTAAAQEPTATQVLDKVYQRYAAIKDYQDTFTLNNKIGVGTATLSGEMAFRRPGRLSVKITAPDAAQVVIDGTSRWIYDAGLQQYTQESLAGDTGWDALSMRGAELGLGILGGSDAANTVHLLLAGQPVTDALVPPTLGQDRPVGDVNCYVVELAMPDNQPYVGSFQLWVGKDDGLVHRMIAHVSTGTMSGQGIPIEIDELHTNIKVDQGLGDEAFTFTPPPGATRVDSFTSGADETDEDSLIGKPAPDVTLKDLDGKEVSIAGLKGKPVLVYVWASWEDSSLQEMSDVEAIYQAGKAAGLVVLGVNSSESAAEVKRALKSTNATYPILLDPDDEFSGEYMVFVPGAVYIDKTGQVRAIDDGLISRGRALKRLAAMGVNIELVQLPPSAIDKARDLRNQGAIAFLTGHNDAAVADLQEAADAVPDDPQGWMRLGMLRAALGNFDEAAATFDKATALAPDDADLKADIADAYLRSHGPAASAVAAAQQATQMQPADPRYWHVLGRAQLAANDPAAAIEALNRAAGINNRDPSIQFDLGTAYEKKGDKAAALAAYQKAAKAGDMAAAAAVKRLGGGATPAPAP
jgi:outer membrane lipoprotein-sorting protein/Flp pilus assembly protein TadD/peroxiredoxin